MRPEDCVLILLASGRSQRYGSENKLLSDLNGRPLIQHVIDNIAPLTFAAQMAVVSDNGVAELLSPAGFIPITNAAPKAGQGHALSLGAKAAKESGAKAALIMLGDMPFVGADHITEMFECAQGHQSVMSAYKGIHMPPALFMGAGFDRLSAAKGDQGAKGFRRPKDMLTCPMMARQAMDIDTPADLAAARRNG